MKRNPMVLLALAVLAAPLSSLGMSEDPLERLTKTWKLDAATSLEFRGEVVFELRRGPVGMVTVETTRALFDQLTVSNWWGHATVAIESGLRGPRERGSVKIVVELPSLNELVVMDHSYGKVSWPGDAAVIRVGEESTLELDFSGRSISVEASWLSSVKLTGKAETLTAGLRHQSRLNAQGLSAWASIQLDEESTFEAGTGPLSGLARHGSRVVYPPGLSTDEVTFKEDSLPLPRP